MRSASSRPDWTLKGTWILLKSLDYSVSIDTSPCALKSNSVPSELRFMSQSGLDSRLQARITAFVEEINALVREAAVDAVLEPEAPSHIDESDSESLQPGSSSDPIPFHIHVSDIAFANRNETKHLPYGEGTLRVGPLRDALARFGRPATIISESPDEESSQIIREVLLGLRDDVH